MSDGYGIIDADPEPLTPNHERKPDPSEPWRYVCPDCGGQVYSNDSRMTYQCSTCNGSYSEDELIDKKGAY